MVPRIAAVHSPQKWCRRSCDEHKHTASVFASGGVPWSPLRLCLRSRPQLAASASRGLTPVSWGLVARGRRGRSSQQEPARWTRWVSPRGAPFCPSGPRPFRAIGLQEPRRPACGPLSPVAPRRTAVAATVRPADRSLPHRTSLVSGVSYLCQLPISMAGNPVGRPSVLPVACAALISTRRRSRLQPRYDDGAAARDSGPYRFTLKLKALLLPAVVVTVTFTAPYVAFAGTLHLICVPLQETYLVHVVLPNFTALVPCDAPKSVPLMVTRAPRLAEAGLSLVMLGSAVTLKLVRLVAMPPGGGDGDRAVGGAGLPCGRDHAQRVGEGGRGNACGLPARLGVRPTSPSAWPVRPRWPCCRRDPHP